MESMESDNISNSQDMASDRSSGSARLVAPNPVTKPNYINLAGNICAILSLGIITYCCFSANVKPLFVFHPILMTLGWLLFMTSAINAIVPGDLATEWMPIRLRSARHWVLQVLGSIIILVGFLLIVLNKISNGAPHFTTPHGKFGLSSFILMFITMSGGIGALYSLKLKEYLPPLCTKLIHASVGLITFSLGMVTIILGHFSTWWSFGDTLRYLNIVLILIVMLFTILRPSLKIYFRLKERIDNMN